MRRFAIPAAVAAALVAATVAAGAGSGLRIHRLHVPPPPVADDAGSAEPPAPAVPTGPAAGPPATTLAPPAPPSPPSPPPAGVGCSAGGVAAPSATGTLEDYSLTLTATAFGSGATLTFRGVDAGADFHTIAIETTAGANLCGTGSIPGGGSASFTVTNLPAGSYTIYCTIHPDLMHEDITVG